MGIKTDRDAFLIYICDITDRGKYAYVPDLCEITGVPVSASVNLVKKMVKDKDCRHLSTPDKKRKYLLPLKRLNGEKYQPPKHCKKTGVTKYPPAHAIGSRDRLIPLREK